MQISPEIRRSKWLTPSIFPLSILQKSVRLDRRRSNRPAPEQKATKRDETRAEEARRSVSFDSQFFFLDVVSTATFNIHQWLTFLFQSLIMLVCAFLDGETRSRNKISSMMRTVRTRSMTRYEEHWSLDSVERDYLHVYSRTERTRIGKNRRYRRTIRLARPSSAWIHRERVSIDSEIPLHFFLDKTGRENEREFEANFHCCVCFPSFVLLFFFHFFSLYRCAIGYHNNLKLNHN